MSDVLISRVEAAVDECDRVLEELRLVEPAVGSPTRAYWVAYRDRIGRLRRLRRARLGRFREMFCVVEGGDYDEEV